MADGASALHVHTIDCLWVWHECDQHIRRAYLQQLEAEGSKTHPDSLLTGWTPSGVGAHTLVTVDPLHIEASIYWSDCCGLHGWIRDGKWVNA